MLLHNNAIMQCYVEVNVFTVKNEIIIHLVKFFKGVMHRQLIIHFRIETFRS